MMMAWSLYNQLLAISVVLLGMIAAFVSWYFRHGGGHLNLVPKADDNQKREWELILFILLEAVYITSTVQTEGPYAHLMDILSLTAYYYWVQTFFYQVTSCLGQRFGKNGHTVVLLNSSVPVFITLELLGTFIQRDLLAPQAPAYLAAIIFIYIIYMVYVIHSSYLRYRRVYGDDSLRPAAAVFRSWMILLAILLPVHVFARHDGLMVIVPFLLAATLWLVAVYVRQAKAVSRDDEEAKARYDHVRELVEVWLGRHPNPLQSSSLSMDVVAMQVGIDRQQLSAYIYESLDTTFAAWLSDLRLKECRRRLLQTTDTLSEIAYQCGYADLPTMSKAFKRKHAISPSQYRNHYAPGKGKG